MNKHLKLIASSFVVALTLLMPKLSHAVVVEAVNYFDTLPTTHKKQILRDAAIGQALDEERYPENLAKVCTEWNRTLENDFKKEAPGWKEWYGITPENEAIYQRFLNGKLVYRPNPDSDEGMIELKISDLSNPLEGTFDLSKCGDASEYLTISTGYRKKVKLENSNKVEIYLAPRFVIEKKLKSSAKHFQCIMDNWKEDKAPIGIFWNWGGRYELSWYDYLTDCDVSEISQQDLYYHVCYSTTSTEPYTHTHHQTSNGHPMIIGTHLASAEEFHVHF